jgi:hypothetical protein
VFIFFLHAGAGQHCDQNWKDYHASHTHTHTHTHKHTHSVDSDLVKAATGCGINHKAPDGIKIVDS